MDVYIITDDELIHLIANGANDEEHEGGMMMRLAGEAHDDAGRVSSAGTHIIQPDGEQLHMAVSFNITTIAEQFVQQKVSLKPKLERMPVPESRKRSAKSITDRASALMDFQKELDDLQRGASRAGATSGDAGNTFNDALATRIGQPNWRAVEAQLAAALAKVPVIPTELFVILMRSGLILARRFAKGYRDSYVLKLMRLSSVVAQCDSHLKKDGWKNAMALTSSTRRTLVSLAARDLIFIRELLTELGITADNPSIIYSDSRSAIGLALDPVAFKKTKHILRAAEFLRDLVARQVIGLTHLSGSVMLADLLTKAVNRMIFRALIRLLSDYSAHGIVSPSDVTSSVRSGGAVADHLSPSASESTSRPSNRHVSD